MSDILHAVLDIGGGVALLTLAYQSIALRQERKRLERTRIFHQDKAEQFQMCGGCGLSMSQDQIEACPGENCTNFKKGLVRPLVS